MLAAVPHAWWMVSTALVLFTRDLRVHDNPVLAAAAGSAEYVLPLFVHDTSLRATGFSCPARETFLAAALADLDSALRAVGAALTVARGDLVAEVCRLASQTNADQVHLAADASGFAARRQRRLTDAMAAQRRRVRVHDEVHTVVGPGRVTPSGTGADHFAVFGAYFRNWQRAIHRPLAPAPGHLRLPPGVDPGPAVAVRPPAPGAWLGGEREGRRRASRWLAEGMARYDASRDDLAADATSGLSPYLHLGCLSARELAERAGRRPGAEAFVRQLAWRDFHQQVLAARPDAAHADYRTRHDVWRTDPRALRSWQEGRTGIPIVDAGMRQLRAQHWMPNRARLIVASFLTKTLYLDWRDGAAHFLAHLVDGDLASNNLNWQWVAGTGTDTRPNRVLNPVRQAHRHDPTSRYARRWVDELAGLDDPKDVHQPWRLGDATLRALGYPPPIVDLDQARDRFHRARRPSWPRSVKNATRSSASSRGSSAGAK